MAFEHLAKDLLKATAAPTKGLKPNLAAELETAGFSRQQLFYAYRDLYDMAEEESTKRQILDSMAKIHGLMTPEEASKVAPVINLQVNGDNVRINAMLCPPPSVLSGLPGLGDSPLCGTPGLGDSKNGLGLSPYQNGQVIDIRKAGSGEPSS